MTVYSQFEDSSSVRTLFNPLMETTDTGDPLRQDNRYNRYNTSGWDIKNCIW
ncbi:hypothetical protein HanIR_Chr12g0575361 [Helianthus annuus]|nr:hypothetical protein HanIR_Chr12g0575361 [Helianthus annuus]